MENTKFDLNIIKEYYDTPVQDFEAIYLTLHGIKENWEIKLGNVNIYYKYTMKKLLGKIISSYHRDAKIKEIIDKIKKKIKTKMFFFVTLIYQKKEWNTLQNL